MNQLPVVKLQEIARELADSGQRVRVLWQEPGSLAFVARGREYRSEFHIDGSDEVTSPKARSTGCRRAAAFAALPSRRLRPDH